MKKLLIPSLIILLSGLFFHAYASNETDAAWFLAYKWIIAARDDVAEYRVWNTITRREMLKVMMNISGKPIPDTCWAQHKFSDLSSWDWGCKYADAAVKAGYIAKNTYYRPDDNVSQVEVLKMIMKAKDIEREQNVDWKEWYVNTAYNEGLLDEKFSNYNTAAIRGWIFIIVQNAITSTDEDMNDLLDFFFWN